MTAISDGVVIGIVLGLVFGAVCYYLYSRQSHLEQKVGLLENILLDLKMATEQTLLSATEPSEAHEATERMTFGLSDVGTDSASAAASATSVTAEPFQPFENSSETRELRVEDVSRTLGSEVTGSVTVEKEQEKANVSSNYESMTYKELTQYAKQRGITGLRNLSKAQVIEAIRAIETGSSTSTNATNTARPLSSWTSSDAEVTPLDQIGSAQDSFNGLASLNAIGSEQNIGDFNDIIGSD